MAQTVGRITIPRCSVCGGYLTLLGGYGRTREYLRGVHLQIPNDFLLPTCSKCGEIFMSPEFSKPLDKILKKEMNKMANEIKKNVPATVEDILAQFTVEEIEKMLATKRAPAEGSPVKVGNRVAIQTVTYHWVG